jgi:hypothetical protein
MSCSCFAYLAPALTLENIRFDTCYYLSLCVVEKGKTCYLVGLYRGVAAFSRAAQYLSV